MIFPFNLRTTDRVCLKTGCGATAEGFPLKSARNPSVALKVFSLILPAFVIFTSPPAAYAARSNFLAAERLPWFLGAAVLALIVVALLYQTAKRSGGSA